MKRTVLGIAAAAATALSAAFVRADDTLVVVELYTSQGCSSCPAADEMLSDLARQPGVLALALHVDYWDYIGWKDSFAQPKFTERQKAYARAAGSRTIYTPQLVIDGVDHVVGAKAMEVMERVGAHGSRHGPVTVTLERHGERVRIAARAEGEVDGPLLVQLVRYKPEETVEIRSGENAGHTITYTNIVTDWSRVAVWDGREALEIEAEALGSLPAAVIVQQDGPGEILAAAALP